MDGQTAKIGAQRARTFVKGKPLDNFGLCAVEMEYPVQSHCSHVLKKLRAINLWSSELTVRTREKEASPFAESCYCSLLLTQQTRRTRDKMCPERTKERKKEPERPHRISETLSKTRARESDGHSAHVVLGGIFRCQEKWKQCCKIGRLVGPRHKCWFSSTCSL